MEGDFEHGHTAPVNPAQGTIFHDWSGSKDYKYSGEKWIEVSEKPKNTFGYRDIYSQGSHVYIWQVQYEGEELNGSAGSVPQAYREARKAVKRYRKMTRFLNK